MSIEARLSARLGLSIDDEPVKVNRLFLHYQWN
jgi:hypothetical protein